MSTVATPNSAAVTTTTPAPKRKPVFVKVSDLRPGTTGHTLVVKVVSSKPVVSKGPNVGAGGGRTAVPLNSRPKARIAECVVGDETGTIIFTARNEQVDMLKPDATVILRNSKIDMFKGSMRLAVDKWGRVEVTEPADFVVKEDNNLSLIELGQREYELVPVEE